MQCPYCLHDFHEDDKREVYEIRDSSDLEKGAYINEWICPNCMKSILHLYEKYWNWNTYRARFHTKLKPTWTSRNPFPDWLIEDIYLLDYKEACLVIDLSPKASAALSRRCLQLILRDKGWYGQRDLAEQIQAALDEWRLPSHISEWLDAIRNIWNFAAHPNKSKHTWEIVDVESGEAEWSLDLLEDLFDYYFIQPELSRQKREKLNQKLSELWKPELR